MYSNISWLCFSFCSALDHCHNSSSKIKLLFLLIEHVKAATNKKYRICKKGLFSCLYLEIQKISSTKREGCLLFILCIFVWFTQSLLFGVNWCPFEFCFCMANALSTFLVTCLKIQIIVLDMWSYTGNKRLWIYSCLSLGKKTAIHHDAHNTL